MPSPRKISPAPSLRESTSRLNERSKITSRKRRGGAAGPHRRRVGARDLKPRRFAILRLSDQTPGLTQTALSRASGRDKSTLTPALDDLERRGLVERRRSPKDRRVRALYLTGGGRSLLRELTRHAVAHDRQLDRILGAGKAQFIAALRRIAMSLG